MITIGFLGSLFKGSSGRNWLFRFKVWHRNHIVEYNYTCNDRSHNQRFSPNSTKDAGLSFGLSLRSFFSPGGKRFQRSFGKSCQAKRCQRNRHNDAACRNAERIGIPKSREISLQRNVKRNNKNAEYRQVHKGRYHPSSLLVLKRPYSAYKHAD